MRTTILHKISEILGDARLKDIPEKDIKTIGFLAYALLLKNEFSLSKTLIENLIQNSGDYPLFEKALVLWVIAEYAYKSDDKEVIGTHQEKIDEIIDELVDQWHEPANYWLPKMPKAIYTVNIASVYGAFTSLDIVYADERIKKEKISIRKYLFDNLLHGGAVVSAKGDKEIYGDLIAMAVPFAYLDAGNQILIKSLEYVESTLLNNGCMFAEKENSLGIGGNVRRDITSWLAWYYAEKGDIAKAKHLLNMVDDMVLGQESYLSYPLSIIANERIAFKEGKKGDRDFIQIIHSPKGTCNPYKHENYELYPREPMEGETVLLRALTQPFHKEQHMSVELLVDDDKIVKDMVIKESEEGEMYWECNLGSFIFGQSVEYRMIVEAEHKEVISESYHFDVLKWVPVNQLMGYAYTHNNIDLYLGIYNDQTLVLQIGLEHGQLKSSIKRLSHMKAEAISREDRRCTIGAYTIEIRNGQLHAIYHEDRTLVMYDNKDTLPIELCLDQYANLHKFRLNTVIEDDEHFYGMGERYSHIEYRGQTVDNYVYNQYRDQGLKSYIPIPFFMSSNGYGMFINTAMYSQINFGSKIHNQLTLELDVHDNHLTYYLLFGDMKHMLGTYTKMVGEPILPPKWSFGPWMSSNNWDTQEEVLKQVEKTKAYKIPSTVCVIEQWSDEATFYIFNDAQYEPIDGDDHFNYEDFTFPQWGRWPNPKEMVENLHKDGLKVLLWQAPVQKFMDGINHIQRDRDEDTMMKHQYCVMKEDDTPYRIPSFEWFKGSLVPDFTNGEAAKWWLDKRKYLLNGIGIDGFKTDGGECIYGEDAIFHNGQNGLEMRNRYPNSYIGAYHDYTKQYVSDGITFSRSGYLGAHKMPIHWAGDEFSTYKAFRSSIRAGLSIGLTGLPIWGWDLGGFHGDIPTDELFLRATQMAAFCPIMQYHAETKGEFNQDRTPWNIAERTGNETVIDIYKYYADLRMNLLPYIWEEAKKSCYTGLPMMRAMILDYNDDPDCYSMDNQYMFGESLLIAPIVEEGADSRQVYLPKGSGKWLHFFDGTVHEGGKDIAQSARMDEIPVYIKEDSIVPLNLGDDLTLGSHVGNQVDGYTNLTFMLYIKDQCDYTLKDGDIDMRIKVSLKDKKLRINTYTEDTRTRKINYMVRNAQDILEVELNDQVMGNEVIRKNKKEKVLIISH